MEPDGLGVRSWSLSEVMNLIPVNFLYVFKVLLPVCERLSCQKLVCVCVCVCVYMYIHTYLFLSIVA
jgi:hypothetical protein